MQQVYFMVVEEILGVLSRDTGEILAQGSLSSKWEFVKKVDPIGLIEIIRITKNQ